MGSLCSCFGQGRSLPLGLALLARDFGLWQTVEQLPNRATRRQGDALISDGLPKVSETLARIE